MKPAQDRPQSRPAASRYGLDRGRSSTPLRGIGAAAPASAISPTTPDFERLFESAPGSFLVLYPAPPFLILAAGDAYLHSTKTTCEHIVGHGIFEVVCPNAAKISDGAGEVARQADAAILRASLERVFKNGAPDMILITGATGTIGKEVVHRLSALGSPIRVFVRDPKKAAPLQNGTVQTFVGDLERPETLPAAFEGVSRLLLHTGVGPSQVAAQHNAIEAAKRAGVRYVVKVSAQGTAPSAPIAIARWHWETEQELTRAGIAFTSLRPAYLMQNTLSFAPCIVENRAFYAPMADARVAMIDTRDIADVVAVLLTQGGYENKAIDVTGPRAISYAEVADSIGRVIGKQVRYVDVPPETARQAMTSSGMPTWLIDDLLGLHGAFVEGLAAKVSSAVPTITGRPGRSYDDFARDHVDVFKGARHAPHERPSGHIAAMSATII